MENSFVSLHGSLIPLMAFSHISFIPFSSAFFFLLTMKKSFCSLFNWPKPTYLKTENLHMVFYCCSVWNYLFLHWLIYWFRIVFVAETTLALLRHPGYCISAYSSVSECNSFMCFLMSGYVLLNCGSGKIMNLCPFLPRSSSKICNSINFLCSLIFALDLIESDMDLWYFTS